MAQLPQVPDTGAVRAVRIAAGASVIMGMLGFGYGRFNQPTAMSSWIGLVGCGLGVVLLVAWMVMRRRAPG